MGKGSADLRFPWRSLDTKFCCTCHAKSQFVWFFASVGFFLFGNKTVDFPNADWGVDHISNHFCIFATQCSAGNSVT